MQRVLSALAGVLTAVMTFSTALAGDLPVLKLGHVGHDHQIALYVAAEAGRELKDLYGVWLRPLKDQEVYELYEADRAVATVHMVLVGGGAQMPAAMEQGQIEVGLGGIAPVAKFIDKGVKLKVLAPLNNDGDALILGSTLKATDWAGFVQEVRASARPLKIGYKDPMAVAYMIFSRALEAEGIRYGVEPAGTDGKPVQVLMVNMQGLSNALPALDGQVVDAVVVNEPMGALLEHKGMGRRAADLSSLPPKGKWENHPCCVVAATEDALRDKHDIVVLLVKAIAAGGDLMAIEPERALQAETRWTRTNIEVAKKSLKNVTYISVPDARWMSGIDTWIELMTASGHFKKALTGMPASEVRARVLDLGPMEEALKTLKLRGAK